MALFKCFCCFLLFLSNKRGWHCQDTAACEHLQQQQGGQSLTETLRQGAIGVRSPLPARLFAAYYKDELKGRAQGIDAQSYM